MNKKQLTMKLSAIAVSILLASCGGGGSEGYFNKEGSTSSENGNNTGGTEGTNSVNVAALKIELDKPSIAATNGQLTVTVRALDENKGGLSDAEITLSIIDPSNNVLNASVAKQKTDEFGNTVYVLTTPSTSSSISDLIKMDLKL